MLRISQCLEKTADFIDRQSVHQGAALLLFLIGAWGNIREAQIISITEQTICLMLVILKPVLLSFPSLLIGWDFSDRTVARSLYTFVSVCTL